MNEIERYRHCLNEVRDTLKHIETVGDSDEACVRCMLRRISEALDENPPKPPLLMEDDWPARRLYYKKEESND